MPDGARSKSPLFRCAGPLLVVASLVITILILEAIFRIAGLEGYYPPQKTDQVFVGDQKERLPHAYIPHAVVRSIYPDNPRNYFDSDNGIDHVFNSAGWRDVEHPVAKPHAAYRILGLGDSYLFGQGVRFADLCLTRLQALLSANSPHGMTVEAINTGIPAFNTTDERDLLRDRGLQYHPDLVIVHFVLNDVEDDIWKDGLKLDFYHEYLDVYLHPDVLSQYSHLWGWLRQRYLRNVVGRRYIEQCLANYRSDSTKFRNCFNALLDIQRICREHNIRLLVVLFPFYFNLNTDYPFRPIHDQLRLACGKAGIPLLDLLPFYRAYEGPELWVHPVDQHPNELAHKIAAQAIGAYLADHRTEFGLAAREK